MHTLTCIRKDAEYLSAHSGNANENHLHSHWDGYNQHQELESTIQNTEKLQHSFLADNNVKYAGWWQCKPLIPTLGWEGGRGR